MIRITYVSIYFLILPEYCRLSLSLSLSQSLLANASFKNYASWDNACVSNHHCVSLVVIVPSDISLRRSRELAPLYLRWFAKQLRDLITRAFEFRRLTCHAAIRFQLESFKSSGGIVSYPLSENLASGKNVGGIGGTGDDSKGGFFSNLQRNFSETNLIPNIGI